MTSRVYLGQGMDLNWTQLLKLRLQNLASDPSSAAKGWIYFNTTDDEPKVYDGTSFVSLFGSSYGAENARDDIAAALVAGNNIDITVNDGADTITIDVESLTAADITDFSSAVTTVADGIINARKWKDSVDAATTANITLSGAQTIDGVSVVAGDRVLVKDQSTAANNGVYVAAAGAWARATDVDSATEINDATVLVDAGTANKGDVYTQTATVTTLGSDTVTFTKTGEGNTTYSADGTSIELSGTTFGVKDAGIGADEISAGIAGNGLAGGAGSALSVNVSTGLEIASDNVRIAADAAGAGLTGGAGSALAVGAGTGVTVNANDVAVDTAVVVRKYAATIGDGASTSLAVTHSLGTKDVTYSLRQVSDDAFVDCDAVATSTSVLTLSFATAPVSSSLRVVVHA